MNSAVLKQNISDHREDDDALSHTHKTSNRNDTKLSETTEMQLLQSISNKYSVYTIHSQVNSFLASEMQLVRKRKEKSHT